MIKRTIAIAAAVPVIMISGCLAVSSIYNACASARWFSKPRGPGALYSVGDHRLYATVRGEGPVTIVIENDVGEPSMTWWVLQERLSSMARVVTYDRAGYGWSEKGPGPRSSGRIVEDLSTLLERTGSRGPYLFIGHGLGGLYARHFAQKYPGSVRAVLLINPLTTDEEYIKKESPPMVYQNLIIRRSFVMFSYGLSCTGLTRTLRVDHLPGIPLDLVQLVRDYYSLTTTNETMIDEYIKGFRESVEQIRAGGPFPPVPLVVLGYNADELSRTLYQFELSYDEVEKLINAKRTALKRTAAISPRGVYIETSPRIDNLHLKDPAYIEKIVKSLLR
ncbi:MAG: alpha/beta hydrolase [Chrysiogenales bacterium]|nr:MAG: alpha/beta hydrolase [Chrysiogenales bacterium]